MVEPFTFLKLDGTFDESAGSVPVIIKSLVATDDRGALIKDFNDELFATYGIDFKCKEVFFTESHRNVIRANHFQLPYEGRDQQAKIVRCVKGEVYDVVTDLRPWSKTYGVSKGQFLNEDNHLQFYVPKWFGHGYYVLKDSIVCYRADEVFTQGDSGIYYADPDLGIDWKIPEGVEPILSEKDRNLISFKEYDELIRKEYSNFLM